MKVLGVGASPRKESVSNTVIQEVLKAAEAKGHEVEFIDINAINPKSCQACMACKKGVDCVIDDGLKGYFEKLRNAGALVIGGPIYFGTYTGTLVSFLHRHYCLRDAERNVRIPAGKKLVGVVSQGQPDANAYKAAAESYLRPFTGFGMELVDILVAGARGVDGIAPALLEQARAVGASL